MTRGGGGLDTPQKWWRHLWRAPKRIYNFRFHSWCNRRPNQTLSSLTGILEISFWQVWVKTYCIRAEVKPQEKHLFLAAMSRTRNPENYLTTSQYADISNYLLIRHLNIMEPELRWSNDKVRIRKFRNTETLSRVLIIFFFGGEANVMNKKNHSWEGIYFNLCIWCT